jgi:hypothetical protein
MRAVALAVVLAAACGKHEDTAKRIDEPPAAAPAPPPPRPIAACDRYVDALTRAFDLDVDPEVRDLLRDEAALIRAATRGARDADRDELTMRCATGMLDLGRIPTYGGLGLTGTGPSGGIVGGVAGGVVGGLAGAPPPPPPPPAGGAGTNVSTVPECRRLFAIFDKLSACPDLADTVKDTFRQARSMMLDAWGQMPQDQDTRDLMARACQTAAETYEQILSHSHCP